VLATFSERVPIHLGGWDPDGSTMTPVAWFIWMKPEALEQGRLPRLALSGQGAFMGVGIPPGTLDRLTKPDDARLFGRRAA
jgi:hypothetical protein